MEVIIEEIVTRMNATSDDVAMSPQRTAALVEAMVAAIDARERHQAELEEELSLENYQQRNPLGA